MGSLRWNIAIFAVVGLGLVAGAIFIQRMAMDRLLYQDAVATGRTWAEYVATNLSDIRQIAEGRDPSPESRDFLDHARKTGQVFLFKIYDATGRVRYESDALPAGETDEEDLAEHNPEAAEAIDERRPAIEAKEGVPPSRPPFYSEAYIPYIVGGRVLAVVETYVDQTARRAEFGIVLNEAAILLGVLVILAFGIPAAAWYVRSRDHQKADARVQYLANYDSLTGLANRTQLGRRLERALRRSGSGPDQIAVHCIDLERFKDVNDRLGHNAGDVVIRTVAERLKSIAGPNDIVARIGGDEFAVVQMNAADVRAAEALAARILDTLKEPYWIGGTEVTMAARIGIALSPEHGTDWGRLMQSADVALHKSKTGAHDRIRIFTPELDEELSRRLALEATITQALEKDRFVLHFQPLYSPSGDKLFGFEALLRLPMPDGGFIPPAVFIPVAEKMGLIDRIGARVIDRAIATASRWPDHVRVAVNLSPLQFVGGDIAAVVCNALKRHRVAAGRLELEITESLLLQDTKSVLATLGELKQVGVSVVMDDFGTGYSSLSYLWRFPFDKLKIDRSFVVALDAGDVSARQIIRTMVGLARSLDMRVTIEGVESLRQSELIRDLGCDEVQGFFYGRPVAESEVGRIVMANFRAGFEVTGAAQPLARAAG
ncbi:MAG TPA: EAL domain-containing protein [Bauldia sp.]|nr:EAL domain-containing protein [Bauldia sp.]